MINLSSFIINDELILIVNKWVCSKEVDDVSMGPIQKITNRPNRSSSCWIDLYESINVMIII